MAQVAESRYVGLKPFKSSEVARQAALKSAEVRRAKRDAKLAKEQRVQAIVDTLDHTQLGEYALKAVLALAQAALSGELTEPTDIRQRKLYAEAAEILHRIARLELGESTSNVAHATIEQDTEARRQELLARLKITTVDSTAD